MACPVGNNACDGTDLLHGDWCKRSGAWQEVCASMVALAAAFAQTQRALRRYAALSEGEG